MISSENFQRDMDIVETNMSDLLKLSDYFQPRTRREAIKYLLRGINESIPYTFLVSMIKKAQRNRIVEQTDQFCEFIMHTEYGLPVWDAQILAVITDPGWIDEHTEDGLFMVNLFDHGLLEMNHHLLRDVFVHLVDICGILDGRKNSPTEEVATAVRKNALSYVIQRESEIARDIEDFVFDIFNEYDTSVSIMQIIDDTIVDSILFLIDPAYVSDLLQDYFEYVGNYKSDIELPWIREYLYSRDANCILHDIDAIIGGVLVMRLAPHIDLEIDRAEWVEFISELSEFTVRQACKSVVLGIVDIIIYADQDEDNPYPLSMDPIKQLGRYVWERIVQERV